MDNLIKKRGRTKAAITRIERFINSISSDSNIDVNDLGIRENLLVKAFEGYDKIQEEIEDLIDQNDDDKVAEQFSDREEVEKKYIACHSKIKSLAKQQISQASISDVTQGASAQIQSNGQNHSHAVKVNLPNINVPIFRGDYGEWRTFIDIFTASIDNDDRLAHSQKFMYLKTFLKGEALSLISELNITDENYQKALDILRTHYDRKMPVINYHINALLNTSIQKGPNGLRDFTNQIRQHINALEGLNVSVMNNWDLMLLNIFSGKLDRNLRNSFELERDQNELPTLKEFFDFLDKRIAAWESSYQTGAQSSDQNSRSNIQRKVAIHTSVSDKANNASAALPFHQNCLFCEGQKHNIYKCFKFLALSLQARRDFVTKNKLCYNCLGKKHSVAQCTRDRCKTCSGKHHTSLHENRETHSLDNMQQIQQLTSETPHSQVEHLPQSLSCTSHSEGTHKSSDNNRVSETLCMGCSGKQNVLLSTARVDIIVNNEKCIEIRALLDSASQTSFITSEVFKRLGITASKTDLNISGISQNQTHVSHLVNLMIKSKVSGINTFNITCGVLSKITCALPQCYIDTSNLTLPNNIELADSHFNVPGKIDMLIGADLYFDLIEPGLISLGPNSPVLLNSKLGWILGGNLGTHCDNSSNLSVTLFTQKISNEINDLIPKFWQLEEVSNKRILSPEDKTCETIFSNTTQRTPEGRFVVNLPLKSGIDNLNLDESFLIAKRRFLSLEKRLLLHNNVYVQYRKFIQEYLDLGHAKYVPLEIESNNFLKKYFLPHHCVIKNESVSTKLRVVFDGSMQTSSGNSLNSVLCKGPTVQADLFDIICRFRTFKYVLTSDIIKMYRQIQINPKHRHLQNILWRDYPEDELKCIELQTVTYGTNCAPFLATRCLVQVAHEGALSHPLASQALFEQCYVDDVLAGSDNLEGLTELYSQLVHLLKSYGFNLHKWVSNVQGFPNNSDTNSDSSLEINLHVSESLNKVLGISWFPLSDTFKIRGFFIPQSEVPTKRNVLSHIARLFDPLGFIGPLIIVGKILMQKIWKSKVDWDDNLAEDLQIDWFNFYKDIPHINNLTIPRLLFESSNTVQAYELHGFSDACLKAYGTCFYLRTIYTNNEITCKLICSKSKVAPLKILTLPRLELCGCVLMARLCHQLCSIFRINFSKIVLWSDSKIALAWLQSSPTRWTTFVCNRVAEIQELTTNAQWQHVSSENNPADHISRGLDPLTLISCTQWWNGPKFLYNPDLCLNTEPLSIDSIPEQNISSCNAANNFSEMLNIISRFSNFSKLQRTIAYCLRFVNNSRKFKQKMTGPLTVKELNNSLIVIVKSVQGYYFSEEVNDLKKKIPIKSSNLIQLTPFLDGNHVLRVTGRLALSNLPFSQKHPIILPSQGHFVELLYKHVHHTLLHAGPQAMLARIRLKFWPINALRQIKKVVKDCVTCFRFKYSTAQQIMGSLPSDRISSSRPFSKVGVDFGGPILIRQSTTRKPIISKAYISLFVCMVTKAIHLELVSSLSSHAFISTLKRFISRRGCPEVIYSDNGTNFQGANNALKEIYTLFKQEGSKFVEFATSKEISWKFIPPNSPHWGGLWEAGIKSTKFHLKRVVGNHILNFEDMSTLLCQIEAILNSRPISPMSSDPSDLNYLTPNHFLIGDIATTFPEKDLLTVPDNRLKLWQHCQKMKQLFWKRWSSEFLNRLQHRPKWFKEVSNLKVDDMVLVKEDGTPPLSWALARIVELKPGKDGKVRLVKIRTSKGEYYRPIVKLCPLPFSFPDGNSSAGGEDVAGLILKQPPM